jgi:hypothetical protein
LRRCRRSTPCASKTSTIFATIGQRCGQPVDLVDDHDIDQAMADAFEQPMQGGPLHIPAGETTVIVGRRDEFPAFTLLAYTKIHEPRRYGLPRSL